MLDTCFCWLSRLLLLFRFPREFNVLLRSFVSFRTWVSTCCSGNLCWLASLLRDVTGEPCWNHGGCLMLVLRCYGFCTVLDFFRWLVSRRESSEPASRSTLRALEGEARESRSTTERARTQTRCFKQSDLDTAHRRLAESVSCGAEPRPWDIPSLHFHVTKNKLLPMY